MSEMIQKILLILSLVISTILILVALSNAKELSSQQNEYIKIYSKQYIGKHPQWSSLMKAIIKVESDNGQFKVGQLDPSFGIAQMKLETARAVGKLSHIQLPEGDVELCELLLNNDKIAIRLEAAYLGYLWHFFNNLDLTIIAYNVGEGKVINSLIHHKYLSKVYLHKVNKVMKKEKVLYGY